ncbi:MAG: TetR family transcriptional regulator [Bacteroidetes bacterium]|nr:MAG: TetR family transcriptional regulator [Bacteroidota bacterium]
MQYLKNDIRHKILDAAKKEFIEKGFKGSSMRSIAALSGVTTSNIYNYYQSKDQIFQEILAPLLECFRKLEEDHNSPERISLRIFDSKEEQQLRINQLVDLILIHRDELKLLLFKSHGSSLESFRDEYTNRQTVMGLEYCKMISDKYPYIQSDISEFFLHSMSSWIITIIGEIVSHNLSPEDIERFVGEYIEFLTAGWKKMMRA